MADSYTAFSGELRPCVSPFIKQSKALFAGEDGLGDGSGLGLNVSPVEDSTDAGHSDFPVVHYASDTVAFGYFSEDHISDCFSRYRSYRPEDNSYQPYDGGPRRQCN